MRTRMQTHVMAVDDEGAIRRLVQLNLERQGYRVSTASDGVEAMEKVAADPPDLIVLDIAMPRMDGIEFLRRLKANPDTAGIRVIMLTARAQDATIFETHRSGADFYLNKPFSPGGLVEAVRETLAGPAAAAPE